jgi:tetratricopeptide (TPR) repeat protein/transcriptional regulator with XRE-family HTH domain
VAKREAEVAIRADRAGAFGTLLRRYREAAGLTQEALAERAGISWRAISDLERGINRAPRSATLTLLARALELGAADRARMEAAAGRLTLVGDPPGAALGGPDQPPLLGRARELALLERHLACQGPPILLLAGEPGIGKSRLLAEAVHRGAAAGWSVLLGGCTRSGGQLPYSPLLQALQRQLSGHATAQQRAALRGCAWLVHLLPELADGPIEPLPPWSVSAVQERRLMFEAVARFLANVAGPAGTLLVLDDLQWAGTDAFDLLTSLLRGSPTTPLRLVAAYRDTEVHPPDPLAVTLADLAGAGLTRHQHLCPLAAAEIHRLLDLLLGGQGGDRAALAARVAARTGGVPFYVVSFAQALHEDAAAGDEAIPWEVAQGIRQRVAALPALAQAVLGATAITVGRAAQVPVLASVLEQPEHAVLGAQEAAWRARLLDEVDGAYRFAHDLVREVVEGDLSAARQMMLHRRMAEALERRPGQPPVEELAYHYAHSDAQDKALLYLERAGDHAAAQYANAAAVSNYRDLVVRLDGLERSVAAALGREKLGAVLSIVGKYDAALAAYDQAVAVYQAGGDQEGVRRALAAVGHVHGDRGTPQDGLARLQPLAAPGGAREPSPGLAAVYTALTYLFRMAGQFGDAVATAEQAVDLAHAVGDDRLLGAAESHRGTALTLVGRLDEARGALEAAVALLEAVGDLVGLCDTLRTAAELYEDRGEFAQALHYTDRALKAAEQSDVPFSIALTTSTRGVRGFYAGDWVSARLHSERAVILSRGAGTPFASAFPLIHLGQLCLYQGLGEEAARYLEESSAIARGVGHLGPLRLAQALLAECDLLAGRPEAARRRLMPLLDGTSVGEVGTVPMLLVLARVQLEIGETDRAAARAGQCVRHLRETNSQRPLAEALWVQALVAIRQGDVHAAEQALEEGLTLARAMPYPHGEGRLLHVYGLLHLQQGEPAPARERLEAALAILQQLGARKDIERTEHVLATLG